jgi:hypothetical protein
LLEDWTFDELFAGEKTEKLTMTKARLDGLYLLLLGGVVFVLLGTVLASTSPVALIDFRGLYYSARCLIQHSDPYNANEELRISQAEGGVRPWDSANAHEVVTQSVYPPTTFSFTVPFAMLPWGSAHILWMALTIASLIFASFLIWNLGADYAPILSGLLVGFLLANSEVLIIVGNIAGIAIGLCVVAVWCFLRGRFILAGILCLAISLAVKPQNAGLVWLYFLLAGGVYRKRALQTLAAAVAFCLPSVLWVWHIAPHWIQELHSNILAFTAHGGINDPGPASSGAHGLAMIISLQEVISVFRDDPRIYNPASYLICAPLLLVWIFATLRSRPTAARILLGLAAIAPLTMLPFYHRQYDAKLLLLAVPACAMLWAEGGLIGRLALLVTTAGFVFNGDIFFAIVIRILTSHLPATVLSGQIQAAVLVFPAPLILLVMSIFYLWVYVRRCSSHVLPQPQ